jgi:hypothetical protein
MYSSIIEMMPASSGRLTTEVYPQGPSEYSTATASKIEFNLPSQGLIDPTTARFEAEVEIVSNLVLGTGTFVLDNPGLGACFQKIVVSANDGKTLWECTNYSDLLLLNTRARGSEYVKTAANTTGYNEFIDNGEIRVADGAFVFPTVSTGSGTRHTEDTAFYKNPNVPVWKHNVVAAGSSRKATLSLPWSIMGGPLAPSKGTFLPAMFMSDRGYCLKVELTLAPSVQAVFYDGTATTAEVNNSSTYVKLSSCKMVYDQITPGPNVLKQLQTLADSAKIDIHWVDSVVAINPSNDKAITSYSATTSKQTRSLRSVIVAFKDSVPSFDKPHSACIRNRLTYVSFKVGSKIMPASGLSLPNVYAGNAYNEVVKCFRSLYASANVPYLPNYNLEWSDVADAPGGGLDLSRSGLAFYAGVNLTDTEFSESKNDNITTLAGVNTSSTSTIVTQLNRNAVATSNPWTFVMISSSDNVLSVGQGTSASYERQ